MKSLTCRTHSLKSSQNRVFSLIVVRSKNSIRYHQFFLLTYYLSIIIFSPHSYVPLMGQKIQKSSCKRTLRVPNNPTIKAQNIMSCVQGLERAPISRASICFSMMLDHFATQPLADLLCVPG